MQHLSFIFLLLVGYQSFSAQFNYKVECEDAQDCPEWFAGLIHASGVCSASLIRQDIIATNYHCVPEALAHEGADCDNAIEFIFPKTASHEEERVQCDRILHLSPPLGKEKIKTDYAFIKLKSRPSRSPIEISQRGFPDESKVTIYKMDPDPSKLRGVVRKAECKAIQNSIINPYFTSNTAPLVLLTECMIIKGNSGSALVLEDGEAHGVVSATLEMPMSPQLKAKIGSSPKLNFGFGSNYSCLDNRDLNFVMEKASDCEIDIDEANQIKRADGLIKKVVSKALQELEQKVNNSAQKDLMAGKPLVLWQARDFKLTPEEVQKNYLLKVVFSPQCLLPKNTDLTPYEKKLSSKLVSMPQEIPEYLIGERLDSYLRYTVKLEEVKRKIPFQLIPKDLLKRSGIKVQFDQRELQMNLCSAMSRAKN